MTEFQKFISIFFSVFLIILSFQNIRAEEVSNDQYKDVIIIDQDFEYGIQSSGTTIKEILTSSDIKIQDNDIIFPSLNYNIEDYKSVIKIIISRAVPVVINVHGGKETTFTHQETVSEVLKEKNIDFTENDYINYHFYEEIFPGIEIKIWRKPEPEPEPEPTPSPIKIIRTGEVQTGLASWYSYIPGNFCAATIYKEGTKLLVTSTGNGRSVIVTVNDYLPPSSSIIIDLEKNAFIQLASLWEGVTKVKVEKVSF